MRDNEWLRLQLEAVCLSYFPEIGGDEEIQIRFFGRSKSRLGSIRRRQNQSEIKINGLLAGEIVPEFVIWEVIAHELVHFVHGFGSSRPRLHRYPHRGGLIDRELRERGAGGLLGKTKLWLKNNWNKVY